jgi:hypothetical protein
MNSKQLPIPSRLAQAAGLREEYLTLNKGQLQSNVVPATYQAVAYGIHVLNTRITAESTRIPIRILFRLEGRGPFEHIFLADSLTVGGAVVDIELLKAKPDLLTGCRIDQVKLNSRPHPQSVWEERTLILGGWMTLTVTGLHHRVDRITGACFKDNHGRDIWHATYCYIGEEPCEVPLPV